MERLFLRPSTKKLFMKGINLGGRRLGAVTSQLKLYTISYRITFQLLSPQIFGEFVSNQRLVFLLGKFLGGKFLTLNQLQRRWFSLASRCCLCQKEEEIANHVLF